MHQIMLTSMPRFDEFQKLLLNDATRIILKRKKVGQFEETGEERRLLDLTYLVSEINKCLENMRLSVHYIAAPSRRPKNISKTSHIIYHYESFIQSTYILQEKLCLVYPTVYKADNKWRQNTKRKEHKEIRKELRNIFSETLESARRRGAHVYGNLGYNDPSLTHLAALNLANKDGVFEKELEVAIKIVKHFKVREINDEMNKCRQYIDEFFELLLSDLKANEQLNLP